MFRVSLGTYEAEFCLSCGESFLDEAARGRLEQRARGLGIGELGKKLKVAKSGNSLVIRIPSALARFLGLAPGKGEDRLVVEVEG